jgi:hypothetical protein
MNVAQAYLDWIVRLHSLNIPVSVAPFNLNNGIILIVVAAVAGYIAGFIFATIWNNVHK